MKKYQITPEHRIEFENIKQKYIDNALRTDAMTDHDKDHVRIAMRGFYKNANLPYPGDNKIIFVSSPLVAQFVSGFAIGIKNGQVGELTEEVAEDVANRARRQKMRAERRAEEVADQAQCQVGELTEDVTEDVAMQTIRAVRGIVEAAKEVEDAAVNTVRRAIEKKLEKSINPKTSSLDLFLAAYISIGEKYGRFGLCSVLYAWKYRTRSSLWPWYQVCGEFFKNVAKIPGEWDKWNPLNLDALHGGVRFMTPDFTIISDRPEILKLDDGVLHCENGPAVKWRDGVEMYYWRGTLIPDWWITKREELTPEIALKWENIEQARCAQEILGLDKILNHPSVNAKLIDAHDDPQIGELYNVTLRKEVGKEALLKVECGTGRIFVMRVDKQYTTALEANASLGGWRKGMKTPPINFIPMIRS